MAYQRKKRAQDYVQPAIAAEPSNLFASPNLEVADSEYSLSETETDDTATLDLRRKQASPGGFDFGAIPLFQRSQANPLPMQRQARPSLLQAKLTVGPAGDQYEQEADRVAAQVVKTINSPKADKPVQRQGRDEEEDIQMKPTLPQVSNAGAVLAPGFESQIQQSKRGGQALEPDLQQSMGEAMGADFSGVKVHDDAQSDQLNQTIRAKAFTTGQDVFFRQGAYNPSHKGGQELIAHELTHVMQQNGNIQRRMDNKIQRQVDGVVQRDVYSSDDMEDFDEIAVTEYLMENGVSEQTALRLAVKHVNGTDIFRHVLLERALMIDKGTLQEEDDESVDVDIEEANVADVEYLESLNDPKFAESLHIAITQPDRVSKPKGWVKQSQVSHDAWAEFRGYIANHSAQDKTDIVKDQAAIEALQGIYESGTNPDIAIKRTGTDLMLSQLKKGSTWIFKKIGLLVKKAIIDPINYWTFGIQKGLIADMKLIYQEVFKKSKGKDDYFTLKKGRDLLTAFKRLVGSVGKISGSLALITGLIGFIPGLQPILGFAAIAGAIAMFCTSINASISVLEAAYDGLRLLFETEPEKRQMRLNRLKIDGLGILQGVIAFLTFGILNWTQAVEAPSIADIGDSVNPVSKLTGGVEKGAAQLGNLPESAKDTWGNMVEVDGNAGPGNVPHAEVEFNAPDASNTDSTATTGNLLRGAERVSRNRWNWQMADIVKFEKLKQKIQSQVKQVDGSSQSSKLSSAVSDRAEAAMALAENPAGSLSLETVTESLENQFGDSTEELTHEDAKAIMLEEERETRDAQKVLNSLAILEQEDMNLSAK